MWDVGSCLRGECGLTPSGIVRPNLCGYFESNPAEFWIEAIEFMEGTQGSIVDLIMLDITSKLLELKLVGTLIALWV